MAGEASASEANLHSSGGVLAQPPRSVVATVQTRGLMSGQSFADAEEIELATRVATKQLNLRAKPWVWGRPQKPSRYRRRSFVYRI
jgi:hypothetical protein